MTILNFEPSGEGKPNYLAKASGKKELTLYLYDVIGNFGWGEGISAQRVVDDLNAAGSTLETVNVRINSPGGSVFEGLTIYNTLAQSKARVIVHVDGMAVSIASVIAMAGAERRVADNAVWMIHKPVGLVWDDADEMRKQADVLDLIENNLINTYAKRTGQKREKLRDMLADETWFNAEVALAMGFATSITEATQTTNIAVPAQLAKVYKHMPRNMQQGTGGAHSIAARRLGALDAKVAALLRTGKAQGPARVTNGGK
jgi:ATP-dependent Clp protease protease subunit